MPTRRVIDDASEWSRIARRAASRYFAIQGAAGALWWIMLFLWPDSRPWFIANGADERLVSAVAVPDVTLFVAGSVSAAVICRASPKLAPMAAGAVAAASGYALLLSLGLSIQFNEARLGVLLMTLATIMCGVCVWLVAAGASAARLFRASSSQSTSSLLVRTGAQAAIFWSTFLILIPAALHAIEVRSGIPTLEPPQGAKWAAVLIFILGGTFGLTSATVMVRAGRGTPLPLDAPRRLVVAGPYRFVRNPMAIAGLVQGAAVALWLGSYLVLIYVILGAIVWDGIVRPLEEHDLHLRFSTEYEHYRRQVRCWIPRLPARHTPTERRDEHRPR